MMSHMIKSSSINSEIAGKHYLSIKVVFAKISKRWVKWRKTVYSVILIFKWASTSIMLAGQ